MTAVRVGSGPRRTETVGRLRSGTVHVDANRRASEAAKKLRALGHETRLLILGYLDDRLVPVGQIARDLRLPISTATMHVAILERAGLIETQMRPASRGLQKVCARSYDEIVVDLPRKPSPGRRSVISMPVGAFSDVSVEPTCGLASPTGLIGLVDDPGSFDQPERITAELLWFHAGYVEYRFPNGLPATAVLTGLQLTAEVCSEAPDFDPDWPSDIGAWINGRHLGDWTCPGDFGDTRGRLTPGWWRAGTMYGLLKQWSVGPSGTSIDGVPLSEVTVGELGIRRGAPIRVRLGVDADATHVGGLNLFGRGFGNYPIDLELSLEYETVLPAPAVRQPGRPA